MVVRRFFTTSRPAYGRPPPAAVLGRHPDGSGYQVIINRQILGRVLLDEQPASTQNLCRHD
jgi:hypothetical protein